MLAKKDQFIEIMEEQIDLLLKSPSKQRRSDGHILQDYLELTKDYLPSIVEYSLTPNNNIKLDVLNRYLNNHKISTFALNRPSNTFSYFNNRVKMLIVKRTFKGIVSIEKEYIENQNVNLSLIMDLIDNGKAEIIKQL